MRFETRDGQAPPFNVADVTLKTGLVDYYEMLQVPKAANLPEIKAAYRRLQKLCHPDILGPEYGNDMSILLNDVRSTRLRSKSAQTPVSGAGRPPFGTVP